MASYLGKIVLSFFTLFNFIAGMTSEKVKIVEEPAVYRTGMNNYYQAARSSSPSENKLVARVKPSLASGPPHLRVLAGKCFSLSHDGYRYEFCPFHNMTQVEQAVRWNSFAGILGVWKEWIIVNNTFQAMFLANGDVCPGEKPRQTKVKLRCGDQNKVVSVIEPTICQYEVRFETPLACPIDAFLVYPALSLEGKKEWEKIEEALYHEEITLQGYNKYRRRLFQKENFIPPDKSDKEIMKEEKAISQEVEQALSSNIANSHSAVKVASVSEFHSKAECAKAYNELLAEVQRLRKKLSTSGQLQERVNTSELTSNKQDVKVTAMKSNTTASMTNKKDYPATLKSNKEDLVSKESASKLYKQNKNLRGDQGILFNLKPRYSNEDGNVVKSQLSKSQEF
ncbi:uncharacterized protein LOC141896398 [Acropora palmata]|uniref:uncharacterized protein LOC141896398 n=1 Tax=Acropora palmata TaxID=6131 RepID=UPI003DA00B98